jgi:hypothetical protein
MLSDVTAGVPSTGLEPQTENYDNTFVIITLVSSLFTAGFLIRRRYQ